MGRQRTEQSTPSTSSAEYIATEIKRHKKSVAIIFAALVIAFAYGLYEFVIQKRPVISSPAIKITRLTATGKVWAGVISPDGKQVVYTVDDAGLSSDGRYVVFISNRTGIFHVYRMDIDGNNLKQLTSGSEGGAAPFFSPDGRWVIYSYLGVAGSSEF